MRALGGWCLVTIALAASCIVPIEDVSSGDGTGGSPTGGASGTDGSVGGTGGTGATESGGQAGTPAGGSAGVTAGGTGGTDAGTGGSCANGMVLVSVTAADFCIDQHEVTQGAYQAFLASSPANQSAACAANTYATPNCNFDPLATPNRPVVCVDWCDAVGYCEAQGKHLCGKIGGGTLGTTAAEDATQDEWYAACSHEGSLPYPYAVLYDGGACNGIDATTISPVDVGSFAKCVGGYPGLFDMSGNVAEWQAACSNAGCYTRGGSYLDLPGPLGCKNPVLEARTTLDKAIGFRCCL